MATVDLHTVSVRPTASWLANKGKNKKTVCSHMLPTRRSLQELFEVNTSGCEPAKPCCMLKQCDPSTAGLISAIDVWCHIHMQLPSWGESFQNVTPGYLFERSARFLRNHCGRLNMDISKMLQYGESVCPLIAAQPSVFSYCQITGYDCIWWGCLRVSQQATAATKVSVYISHKIFDNVVTLLGFLYSGLLQHEAINICFCFTCPHSTFDKTQWHSTL